MMKEQIIIIGAGVAGLSAALELAQNGIPSLLVSEMPSERAQSVMAEGGINAAADTQADSPTLHAEETLKAGRYIADPEAVAGLTQAAPEMIGQLFDAGMSFTLNEEGKPDVRAFGGQSVKRTFYAASNTGKQLMDTLIDQTRRYEADGVIERLTGWQYLRLLCRENQAYGCVLTHAVTQEHKTVYGKIIIASGGLNGMFGNATGSVRNSGAVTASLFADGVKFANGEFIQYHPTTAQLHGKNMLISEAVRGEGGRLFVLQDGKPFYFMEEKYPELGNLMPRDVVAREEWFWMEQGKQIYLDMSHLERSVCETKLRGVVEDCRHFLSLDPTREPIPVTPGIHYFMGGIWVDREHHTSMKNLYAAGECACQYHGANRLGGNSLLGAWYGGRVAAQSAMKDPAPSTMPNFTEVEKMPFRAEASYVDGMLQLRSILREGLGIVRDEQTLQTALDKLETLFARTAGCWDETATEFENQVLHHCCLLGKAMLLSALNRKESRGAHFRKDYPTEQRAYQKQTVAQFRDGTVQVWLESAGEQDAD